MSQALTELIRKKQQQATGKAANWDELRDQYLAAVQQLYRDIEVILVESIRQKSVTLQRRPKQLAENFIGTYAVEDLLLVIGDEQVRFSPRGRNIVGAAGRIDVIGERGEVMLILGTDGKWQFVQSRQPKLSTILLDETSLAEALQQVMRD